MGLQITTTGALEHLGAVERWPVGAPKSEVPRARLVLRGPAAPSRRRTDGSETDLAARLQAMQGLGAEHEQ